MSAGQQLAVSAVHWVASVVVLAEALNKLERADLFDGRCGLQRVATLRWLPVPWHWQRRHLVTIFKICGWSLLAIGAAGGVVTPFLKLAPPDLQDAAVLTGFAVLIVRSRIKEG